MIGLALALWAAAASGADTDVVAPVGVQAGDTDLVPRVGDDAGDTDVGEIDSATPTSDPLASARFSFCHEEGADADQLAMWCDLLTEAPPGVCPGMRETCAAGKFDAAPTGCDGFGGGGEVAPGFARGPQDDESPWRRATKGCEPSPGGFGDASLRWGMAGVVAVALLLALRWLVSFFGVGRASAPKAAPREPTSAPELDAIEGDDDLGALPEDELLARARRALEAGALGEAVLLARGAALRRLARRGLVALHKARTDREYVRSVAREPETRAALGDVLGAVEDLRWAGRVLTPQRARDALHAAARILGALVLIVLVGWPRVAEAGSRRLAPNGDAALYALMQDVGYQVNTTGGVFLDLDGDVAALMLDLYSVQPTDAEWSVLEDWVDHGGRLFVAGAATPHLAELGVVRRFSGLTDSTQRSDAALDLRLSMPRWPNGPNREFCGVSADAIPLVTLPLGAPRLPSSVAPVDLVDTDSDTDLQADTDTAHDSDAAETPVGAISLDALCPEPSQVVALPRGSGWVIGISDPLLLRNAAMVLPQNRAFLIELVGADPHTPVPWAAPLGSKMVIASASSMAAPANPVESMANARMLPFVLHLLAWWVLLALWRGWPLSPLREPPEVGRLAFVDHVVALGRQWETRGASRHAASQVAQLALQRHGAEGLATLAHRAGLDPAQVVSTTLDLAGHPDGPNRPEDLEFMEALWTLMSTRRT